MEEDISYQKEDEAIDGMPEAIDDIKGQETSSPLAELSEYKDKYIRLYAEFDNYRKRVQKDKEDILKYGNESLLNELLPVIDNLEMALRHSADAQSEGIIKGVEMTMREFRRVLEKFGLVEIEALGMHFDPSRHHAMTMVERPDIDEMTVVGELRKGYMLADKVLRPSMVAVSKKPSEQPE